MGWKKYWFVGFSALAMIAVLWLMSSSAHADSLVVGPDGYSSISDAVDAARNGDIIYVEEGVYHESVVVDKRVSIIGTDATKCIVDGDGTNSPFIIKHSYVKIEGLTIKGAPSASNKAGVYIDGYYGTVIKDCIFENNDYYSVYVNNGNLQAYNITINGGTYGVYAYNSKVTLVGITVSNCTHAIDASHNSLWLMDSTLINNSYSVWMSDMDDVSLAGTKIINGYGGVTAIRCDYCLIKDIYTENLANYAIRGYDSYIDVRDSYVKASQYGVMLADYYDKGRLVNSSVDASISLYLSKYTELRVLNSTYANVYFDTNAQIVHCRLLEVIAMNAIYEPINVDIVATDGNGYKYYNDDALWHNEGYWFDAGEYVEKSTGVYYKVSNYTISVNDGISTQEKDVVINGDLSVEFLFNYPPKVVSTPILNIDEDEMAVNVINLDAVFEDVDNITYSVTDGDHVHASLDNAALTLWADKDWYGNDTIIVEATDTFGESTVLEIPVIVHDAPDAIFDEDTTYTIDLTKYFPLGWTKISWGNAKHVSMSVQDSTLIISPERNWFGHENITLYAYYPEIIKLPIDKIKLPEKLDPSTVDNISLRDHHTYKTIIIYRIIDKSLNITVLPVNDPPVLRVPTLVVDEDEVT
ncbi:MAG: hypothetical protein DRN20_01895, partial [Thermoplasmata archaeon]